MKRKILLPIIALLSIPVLFSCDKEYYCECPDGNGGYSLVASGHDVEAGAIQNCNNMGCTLAQ